MQSLKPKQQFEPDNSPHKWNIGIDRRHVAIFVGLALIAGIAFGYAISSFTTPAVNHPDQNVPTADSSSPSGETQLASIPDSDAGEFRRVTRIIRADTVEVEGVGIVQMIGIETPDGKTPAEIYGVHGQRALEFVEKSLLGQEVRLESDPAAVTHGPDTQKMAYVYTRDGSLFNAEMVKQGHALVRVADSFRLIDQFRLLEADAMRGMRGIWGFGGSSPGIAGTQTPLPSQTPGSPDSRPRRLTPLLPSELGPNVPAVAGATTATEATVWTSSGDRTYHKIGCEYLGKKRQATSASQARAEGYVSCSRCFASTVLKVR